MPAAESAAAQGIDQEASMLKGKKVIALGERDGIQGGAIAACARAAGADVVLEKTYCFV